jgi:hypothetical protein
MNKNIRYAVLVLLIIGILLELALSFPSPLLYTIGNDTFSSPFHENVDAFKEQALNSTTDIDPLLQEFINYPGPISLDIHIHDFDQARRDLEAFGKSQGSLNHLIVHLDMTESEIAELENNTAEQEDILNTLRNTSASLDSLQSLEIQYQSENNQDMLTTVRLQGDALRKKVQGFNERYQNATENVVRLGTKFGLDVTKNNESQVEVEHTIREITQTNAGNSAAMRPADTILIPGEDRVSLFLKPSTGKYRDIIEYMGISLTLQGNNTLRAVGTPVTLYENDQPVSTVVTDTFGYYDMKLPIEQARVGENTVYVRTPTSRSMNRTLTVVPVDSVTTLNVSKPDSHGTVRCTGSVIADEPVRSASVQLSWDKTHIVITKTNTNGQFAQNIQLPMGTHTIIADFYGDGYPINASESDPQIVDISPINIPQFSNFFLLIISVIGIFFLFIGVLAFYLWRMVKGKYLWLKITGEIKGRILSLRPLGTRQETEFPDDWELEVPQTESSQREQTDSSIRSGDETLIAYYTRLLNDRGLSDASRKAYEQLAVRIARDFRIRRYKTLTAREISRKCRGKPYCSAFTRLISVYERIRYGGERSVKDQTIFETALHSADDLMGDEEH